MKAGNGRDNSTLEDFTEQELVLLFPTSNAASAEETKKGKAAEDISDLPVDLIEEFFCGASKDNCESHHTPDAISDKHENECKKGNTDDHDKERKDGGFDDETLKKLENNLFVFASEKAGMEAIDKESIARKIEEASRSSEYYKREKEKLEAVKLKVEEKKKQLDEAKANSGLHSSNKARAKKLINEYRQEQDVSRTWVHVDMDMFYAAIEIKNNPSLADKPIAVGTYSMISTANYVARKYGVRSAMPGFIGKKLCPDLIFVSASPEEYARVSGEVMEILEEYDPELESVGLDEAALDVTGYLETKGEASEEGRLGLAREVQRRIFEKVGLTASCGVAANKMLAKISCDMKKPNGVTLVPFDAQAIEKFMLQLSVRKIPGIGKVNEQLLNGLGFNKCEDILQRAVDIYTLFNREYFEFYMKSVLGISRNRHGEKEDMRKSVGVYSTFRNITLLAEFKTKVEELADELMERVEAQGVVGRTLTLTVKTYKFVVTQK